MRFSKIIRLFQTGNVSVSGLQGRGKDMLLANVVVRRRKPYVSNVNYGKGFQKFDFDKIDLSGNTYLNFISGDITPYHYPYEDGTDFYLSDAGLLFPSHYCNELNRKFPTLPTFAALVRQLGQGHFHFNTQALNRMWDKFREQSDTYICCRRCFVFFGFVLQHIRIYERYESAVANVPVFPIKKPWFNLNRRLQWDLSYANYLIAHGEIRSGWLFYRNKSKYDTRIFKTILEGGSSDA